MNEAFFAAWCPALAALRIVTAYLFMTHSTAKNLWSGSRLLVSRAGAVFDANGEITDSAVRDSVRKFVAGFAAYIKGN